jgi:Flp pilus assembly protein TadG
MRPDSFERALRSADRIRSSRRQGHSAKQRRGIARFGCRSFDDRGQTLVEFALVLPVLLIVLTGIFAFGIILNQYEILTNAVSSGARMAAMSESAGRAVDPSGTYNSDPCGIADAGVIAGVPTLNRSNLTLTVTYTVKGNSSGTSYKYPTTCSGQAMQQGDTIQIVATYSVTPVMMNWNSGTIKMSAQASEFVQ